MNKKTKLLTKILILPLLIGSSTLFEYTHNYPTYVTAQKNPQKLETKLLENRVSGEIKFNPTISPNTKKDLFDSFQKNYLKKHGFKPNINDESNNNDPTIQEIIDFSSNYVQKHISFYYPVLFAHKIVAGTRKIPKIGEMIFPKRQFDYFQNSNKIDFQNSNREEMRDCYDYSQANKQFMNQLFQKYNLPAKAHRIRVDNIYQRFGFKFKGGDHDINQIEINQNNKKTNLFIDSNGPDTWLLRYNQNMSSMVRNN